MEKEKMKRCSKCKQLKPLSQFNKRRASPDGHTYTCKECEAAAARESYRRRKNKEKQRKYYQEHREERLEYYREYYQENKERKAEYDKEYQKKNPEVMRRAHAKRRLTLRQVKREPYSRMEIIQRDSKVIDGQLVPICQICGEPIWDMNEVHLDHIIPIAKGGPDTPDNVRVTHKSCNLLRPKDARDLVDDAQQTE